MVSLNCESNYVTYSVAKLKHIIIPIKSLYYFKMNVRAFGFFMFQNKK